MNGLAFVLLIIVAFSVLKIGVLVAYEESDKKIHLEEIQTFDQGVAAETLKEKWLANFYNLLNESKEWNTSK